MRAEKSALSEKHIVDDIREGRREGQTEMVGRYAERVFALIARMVPDVMDAEELTQDTFLRAFNHIDSYDASKASLSTWLCRIAYRLTLDFLKRRRPLVVSIEESEVWQTDISDEQLEAELSTGKEEGIQRLKQLMDDLMPDEQMLLTMHYYENRPLDECAFIMDSTPHALANRLYRLRKKLYKQLQTKHDKP